MRLVIRLLLNVICIVILISTYLCTKGLHNLHTYTSNYSRSLYGMDKSGAGTLKSAICSRIAGLTLSQQRMCATSETSVMLAIGDGLLVAKIECQRLFANRRWNCTTVGRRNNFVQHPLALGSKEAAFSYAISSAAVTYNLALECSRGNISGCGCGDLTEYKGKKKAARWKWSGCSVDLSYASKLARRFLDAREIDLDARSLMNIHNNRAGRKAVKRNLKMECKCHGMSGSCSMKTCWRGLPKFSVVGDYLMTKYNDAKMVLAEPGAHGSVHRRSPFTLISRRTAQGALKHNDLVFLQQSPTYCDRNLRVDSLGTIGRTCNRTSKGTDGCDLMCCGRGYNTQQLTKQWQCNCKFHWCCYVKCETCSAQTEQHTCK